MNKKLLFRVDVATSVLMCIAMLYASFIVLTDKDALLTYLVGANMLLSVLILLSRVTRKESKNNG